MSKGGISIPPYLVVIMITMVIVIAVAYLFLSQTGGGLMQVFEETVKKFQKFMCGIVPVVGQMMCGG